jgi:uncharacterized repeat protein (TIGR01451 family)
MKTKIYPLGKEFCFLMILGLFSLCSLTTQAQQATGYCTVLHQPCNGDGVLLVTTSGMTPPITFTCYDPYNTTQSILTGSDVTFYNMEMFSYVHVVDAASNYLDLQTGMVPPFVTDYPTVTPAICPNPGSALITVNSGIMPDYVEWYDNSTPFPGAYVGTGDPMSLYGGRYQTKVYYGGCYLLWDSGWVNVSSQSPINFTLSSTTANCTNGTATVSGITGGTGPYTIDWAFNHANTPTITGLCTGFYDVTVTDIIGCYTTSSVYVPQAVQIGANMVITQIPTCLQHNGKVMTFGSGGTSPYSYLYSDGQYTQEAINLSGGTSLSVTVTDHNGCLGSGNTYLHSSTPIAVTYTAIPSSCTAPTGSATLSITGGTGSYTTVWNTYPQQTGITASNLPPGNYSFTVTDGVGCIQTGIATIPPISIINASAWSIDPVCPATTGTVGVYYSGTNPFSFLWNTGQNTSSFTGALPDYHSCVITDGNGCSVTKGTYVQIHSPIHIGFTSTPASCMYATDGSLLATPLPAGSYTYHWSNGSTSNPAINLAPGWYHVTVTDGVTGCTGYDWSYVGNSATSDACYCTIEGTVYYDANTNCAADAGETGIEHISIHLAPFGYAFTDNTGHYSFRVPTGNYTLSEVVQYTYPLTSPCSANDPVAVPVTASSGCTVVHDFFNDINPLHDAHIITFDDNYAIPGNTYRQKLLIHNDGTVHENNIYLNYYPDAQLGSFTTIPFLLDPQSSFWDNTSNPISKDPGQGIILTNSFPVPANIPLGTDLNYTDYVSYEPPITNWLNDYTPWNNINNLQTTVVGSFDPNFKEVAPKGIGTAGTISRNDSVLDYIIHFQNTGTYYAENIEIIDTLDTHMNLATLLPGGSSHPSTAELSENGVLKFSFKNIHLVWESKNAINSNGFVTYSIKQKPGLAIGTQIKNTAAIFFDYNAPVMTGTTLNTIGYPVGSKEVKKNGAVSVYPDPVSTILYVKVSDPGKPRAINVYDITGRMVATGNVTETTVQKVDVGNLANGVYFLELIRTDGTRATEKFVKK